MITFFNVEALRHTTESKLIKISRVIKINDNYVYIFFVTSNRHPLKYPYSILIILL